MNILVGDIVPEELRAPILAAAGPDNTVVFAEERGDVEEHRRAPMSSTGT